MPGGHLAVCPHKGSTQLHSSWRLNETLLTDPLTRKDVYKQTAAYFALNNTLEISPTTFRIQGTVNPPGTLEFTVVSQD